MDLSYISEALVKCGYVGTQCSNLRLALGSGLVTGLTLGFGLALRSRLKLRLRLVSGCPYQYPHFNHSNIHICTLHSLEQDWELPFNQK